MATIVGHDKAFVYAVKMDAPWAPEPMYLHPLYFTEEDARERAEEVVQPGWTYEIEGFSVRASH